MLTLNYLPAIVIALKSGILTLVATKIFALDMVIQVRTVREEFEAAKAGGYVYGNINDKKASLSMLS